jgi:hypothetical protein
MKKFIVNNNYMYSTIEDEYKKENNTFYEFGFENSVGEGFIVIKNNDKDLIASFMLVSVNKSGYLYQCIYNDWKE